MTAADKQKKQVLVFLGLLVVAGLTWFFVYRTSGTATPSAAKAATVKPKKELPIQDAKIRIDLIEGLESADVGQKNIFQYRQKPVAAPPPSPPQPPRPIIPTGTPTITLSPQQPSTPPMKVFKYEGLSISPPKSGRMIASITEGNNTYTVELGECVMGQYCVRRLTETEIEIEDTQLKQRRSFQRTLQ
jgi:hypothetical protein